MLKIKMLNRSQNSNKKQNLENSYQKVSDNNNNQKKRITKPTRLTAENCNSFNLYEKY